MAYGFQTQNLTGIGDEKFFDIEGFPFGFTRPLIIIAFDKKDEKIKILLRTSTFGGQSWSEWDLFRNNIFNFQKVS